MLGEIFTYEGEINTIKEARQYGFAKQDIDIESQRVDGRGKGIGSSSFSLTKNDQENVFWELGPSFRYGTLLSALFSLCGTAYDMAFITELPPHLDASSFLKKLEHIVLVAKINDHHTVQNLLLCKVMAKMVISMMKHNLGRFVKEDGLESFIETLYHASKKMLNLDHSMVFRSASRFETRSKLDRCTLASLVKEARELHAMVPYTSLGG